MKLANSLTKGLNVMSFNYSAFAYHFVEKAPQGVIRNFFKAFEAVSNVLIARLETDTYSGVEQYECAIIALRIQDGLAPYEESE
jgi:hypothetical protein